MNENYLKVELYQLMNNDTSIFEFIQSGSLDGIWYWDLKRPEQEWMSPKFWETLGYHPLEKKHLASEWQDIIFKEDLALATLNFQKHCEDPNHPYDQVVRYRHKNGSTVWIRCRGLAIRDENGTAIRMLGAHTDITELKEAEKKLSRLTKEYERVFNGTQDAMFLIEVLKNGGYRYVRNNLAHQMKTGISLDLLIDKSPQDLLGKEMGDLICANYDQCLAVQKSISYEEQLSLPAGERIWLTTLTPILENATVTHIVGSSTDITERKKLENELDLLANYDKLTGLPNRRLFFERLNQMILEHERDRNHFTLLFIDLDGFKAVNDTLGHEVGDQVLIETGLRLQQTLRRSDTAARMGGDEFTVIARHMDGDENIDRFLAKLQKRLEEKIIIGAHECAVGASIGIAVYPKDGESSESLLQHADAAMYAIKRERKNA